MQSLEVVSSGEREVMGRLRSEECGTRAGEEWYGLWDTSLIYEASRKYGVTELLIQDCLKDVSILTMQVET